MRGKLNFAETMKKLKKKSKNSKWDKLFNIDELPVKSKLYKTVSKNFLSCNELKLSTHFSPFSISEELEDEEREEI